jgi:predicted nucleic acid-binding Zn ribbon protein
MVSPATILVTQLADARRDGQRSFETAWPLALSTALAAAPNGQQRREWREVLSDMVLTWRSAWERRPAPARELALVALAADPERTEPATGRECEHCGLDIPPDRGSRALYCSNACGYEAKKERVRQARQALAA